MTKKKLQSNREQVDINPLTEVVIQKAWLRGLLDYKKQIVIPQGAVSSIPMEIHSLLGYIESASYILKD